MAQLLSSNPAPKSNQQQQSWTSSQKQGVGTSRDLACRMWYTVANGIITEIYYPDIDTPQIRDLQLIITDGATFFHDCTRDLDCVCEWIDTPAPNPVPTPALRLTLTAKAQPYKVVQELFAGPQETCILWRTTLQGEQAFLNKLKVYVLLAPHMSGVGAGNSAQVARTSSGDRLVATCDNYWVALGADCGFGMTSCGFVGFTDGWTDIVGNKRLPAWSYDSAFDGYIALTGEINRSGKNQFVIAMAFCLDEATSQTKTLPGKALVTVSEALSYSFDDQLQEFLSGWQSPVNVPYVPSPNTTGDNNRLFTISRNVLYSHCDKLAHGAVVASLSIPWGETVYDLAAGYHLVWPRDMTQSALALLAAGEEDAPLRGLMFLAASQSGDGSFQQKFYISGQPWPNGAVQLDEFSFPIILAYRLSQANLLQQFDPRGMVLSAAGALIANGPMTQQERWEEIEGYSPSTLASNIAALVCAADLAKNTWNDPTTAQFLFDYADFLESNLEGWCVTTQGGLVPGISTYYIRINPTTVKRGSTDYSIPDPNTVWMNIWSGWYQANAVVDGGFLELVRYGIRDPHDPIIVNSVKVIDAVLKEDVTGFGPGYHRYNHDGYGQGYYGEPWKDGTNYGIGRPWPLLTGERGHYEVASNSIPNAPNAKPYVGYLEAFAGQRKLLPEQIWDQHNPTNPPFVFGGPAGSAMPLAWAHAEYIKLVRSVSDGKVFDRLDIVVKRYIADPATNQRDAPTTSSLEIWNFDYRPSQLKAGKRLRILLAGNFRLRWTSNNWASFTDANATPTSVGIYYVDLSAHPGQVGTVFQFTFFWLDSNTWQGTNYSITVTA